MRLERQFSSIDLIKMIQVPEILLEELWADLANSEKRHRKNHEFSTFLCKKAALRFLDTQNSSVNFRKSMLKSPEIMQKSWKMKEVWSRLGKILKISAGASYEYEIVKFGSDTAEKAPSKI